MLETNRIMSHRDTVGDIDFAYFRPRDRMNRQADSAPLRNGCILLREGAKHSIYCNLFTGAQTTVPVIKL